MRDWMNDPLMVFNTSKGRFIDRKPKIDNAEADKWHHFHFAVRSKLEGSVYFCRQLLGASSLPSDIGIPPLADAQRRWYAGAFFFFLCSAYDSVLQEINVVYRFGLPINEVVWTRMGKKPAIKGKLKEENELLHDCIQQENDKDWFKKVKWYRNTATHHYLIPMGESTTGWGEQDYDQQLEEVTLFYYDEEAKTIKKENVEVCQNYLTNMIDFIRNVWSEMEQMFEPVQA